MSLSLMFMESDNILWSFVLENIEQLVGMLAVGMGICNELNYKDTNKKYHFDSEIDVSDYRLANNVLIENITEESGNKLYKGEYGIWIKSNNIQYYNLYRFTTNYFFQGTISLCKKFEVDFRDYIYGLPFDGYGNKYKLAGYSMTPYQIVIDVIDLDDIEEEERDDENKIEPFARSDEIITIKD